MNYYSTTEAAKKWEISPRRVALLAAQGRIAGAVLKGNSWLIPDNAQKPEDQRKKSAKASPAKGPSEQYFFPHILCCVHSEDQVNSFSEDERAAYRLCLIYETGDFNKTREVAESLLTSDNLYVRLCALYHLSAVCLYLSDFAAKDQYSVLFRTAIHNVQDHKPELKRLLMAYIAEFESSSLFASEMEHTPNLESYSPDFLPLIAAHTMFAEMYKFGIDGTVPDIAFHEIVCRMTDAQGYFYCAMLQHLYLFFYYSSVQDEENTNRHLSRSIELALEHNTLFTLSCYIAHNAEFINQLQENYSAQFVAQVKNLAQIFIKSRNDYAEYQGTRSLLSALKEEDYELISLCGNHYSIEKMAEKFGLSQSGMKKRLAALYRKLGVRSKSEMIQVFLHSVLDWGKA